jgi:hypothetical protein
VINTRKSRYVPRLLPSALGEVPKENDYLLISALEEVSNNHNRREVSNSLKKP